MSVVIRLKVPIEMHYAVIPMGTSKVNSSRAEGLILTYSQSTLASTLPGEDQCCMLCHQLSTRPHSVTLLMNDNN